MLAEPGFEAFAARYRSGEAGVVRATLVGDLETPVAAFLKLRQGHEGAAFLLESVEGGAVRGRYSMIGLDPDLVWRCRDGVAEIDRQAQGPGGRFAADERPPLESLRALIAESAIPLEEDLPPMSAGLFGYLGYDMVRLMERLPEPNPDALGVPDAILIRPSLMVVFDAVRDEISLIAPVRPQSGVSAKAAYEGALARLERAMWALERPLPFDERHDPLRLDADTPRSNTSEAEFLAMVERSKEYIRAGDVFQVVLSQRFEADFPLPAFALYRSLRRVNPAPFLCYLDFEDFQIVCSSPEILVRVRDGTVTIRPIAGTRPRGANATEDKRLADELLADPKERAEHLMLLDLGRNDVGRVSALGSVRVTDSFFLEHYSQVMHIVSNVEGRLDPAPRRARRARRRLSVRHRLGRPQGAGDGDHRRARAREARAVRRLHRLFRRQGRDGHLHRAAHRDRQGRPHVGPGRRRHRLRLRPRRRAAGMHQQGQGAVPRGGGRGALREPGDGGGSRRRRARLAAAHPPPLREAGTIGGVQRPAKVKKTYCPPPRCVL